MPVRKLFNQKIIQHSTGQSTGILTFFSKPRILGLVAFILLSLLFSILIFQRYQLVRETKEKEAVKIVHEAKEKLQETLMQCLAATKTLSFFIDKQGQVSNFDSLAAQIIETVNEIDAIQLVPDGIIQYVYPLKGNEHVIGYNILEDPLRNKEALKAIEKKEMFFAGPFELKQGGLGVVGRLPIYRNHKFWGFSAVVIRMPALFRAAGIDSTGKNGYYFQLSKINPDTKKEEFFLPQFNKFKNAPSVSINVPDGAWKLSVTEANANNGFGDIALLTGLCFLLSVLGALFVYRFAIRPQQLNEMVVIRTRELKASENNYRSLIERVSDAFVSVDKEWKYTYVNKKAGEIFAKDPKKLIGKNIWEEFPEGINQPLYTACYNAMETQEYQYLEEHYATFNKWLENHIYPSVDGVTVFFKDVTDIKQVTQALKINEEKYRSLIEQASDGIVITDLDGIILEVNKSLCAMSGYSEQELIGKPAFEFIPQEDLTLKPLLLHELLKGKALLSERRLMKKEGTVMEIEINSKMASSHTLIGFIRDITERKQHEDTLIYQANLLQSVSDAITSLDMNRCIVSWNRACEELFGFTTEEVIGKRIPELVTFEYPNTTNEEVFKKVYNDGQWKGEFNFIHPKSGLKIDLLSSVNILKNKAGQVVGFIITSRDITERKKAEEALKKSNERFELIADATNDAVWDHDLIKNETWGNKKLYDIYGFQNDKQKINFEMFIDRIHPDERGAITERMQFALQHHLISLAEQFRFKTASDGYRDFYDRAYIKYDDTGKPVRILGAMLDITESEKAKKTISESEEKFRTIIEQASDGIFISDKDRYFINVNSSGCRMLGYTLDELKKIRFSDIVPPEDLINNPIKISQLESGESVLNERRLLRKDGTVINVEINAKKLPDGRFQSIARDITERKKEAEILQHSEQKYRLLFYNNPLPMWMTTLPGLDIIDVNEAAIKQYGYSREEFLKLNTRQLRPAEDVENFLEEVDKMQPDMINIRDWRHKKKDGTIIYVETYSHEIVYEGQRVWLGLSHDVTDKYEAKRELQKSYEDIRQLASNLQSIREDERTSIAREIHDELGQQLTGLKMDLHWLTRKINSTDEDIRAKMKESIELINATISSVRKISTDLRPSILDDLGLLSALEWQGEEFEKRSGTKVEFINKAGDITVQPEAATGIFRIYQELLTNIARHANASRVKAVLHKDDSRLYFSITDNGIGFDIETINNKKTLGLLGIKERTLILGGTYEFKSKPGEGTNTNISIPITLVKTSI